MILEHFVVGMLQTNCYLVGDPETGQAVIIDPGGNSDKIAARLQALRLELAAILNTHAHFDHVLEAWSLKKQAGGDIYLHPKDEALLHHPEVGLGAAPGFGSRATDAAIDHWLQSGETLRFGSLQFEVIETPGHTPGHVSFYVAAADMIFVGDTLFAGSIGRTDFPGGSHEQLIQSVRNRIFVLRDTTVVYPGHGPETTVAREKSTNPFFV